MALLQIPTTSTELLRNLSSDANHPRWTEFVERYRAMMLSFLATRYPGVEADDIVQETLVSLVRILPDYRYEPEEKGLFHNYLLGIVRNKAHAVWIKRCRQERREAEFSAAAREDDGATAASGATHARRTVYEIALRQVLADPSIHERTKQVFIRTAIDGEKPEAIAAAFGVSRNAVDQMKSRMMDKLRTLIRELETVDGADKNRV